MEKADGACIFSGHEQDVKYYGGLGAYFIYTELGYLDLLLGGYCDQIPYMEAIDVLGASTDAEHDGSFSVLSIDTLAVTSNQLPYTKEVVQRLSFGDNSGAAADTCTAVASGLVLNYLRATVDKGIVPYDWSAEYLSGTRDWDGNRYKGTAALHSYLA